MWYHWCIVIKFIPYWRIRHVKIHGLYENNERILTHVVVVVEMYHCGWDENILCGVVKILIMIGCEHFIFCNASSLHPERHTVLTISKDHKLTRDWYLL